MNRQMFLCNIMVLGLLMGGFAYAHNFDPEDFQPTGTTQRAIEYDPFHNFAAGIVTTVSTGVQPLVGEYECEGVSDFEIDTIAANPTQELLDECELTLPYVYSNEEVQCRVVGTDLTFTLAIERAQTCYPSFSSCFVYDESIPAYIPQAGCAYKAFWTSILTEENVGLRVITKVTEDITYTNVIWDAERQRIKADMNGTLTGEVKRIDFNFSEVDKNRQAVLENPVHDSHVSGIGQITGWACSDLDLEVEIQGADTPIRFPIPHGVSRSDTESVCGDTLNGFSTVFNWNIIPSENKSVYVHLIQQGKIIDTKFVRVTAFEEEFLRGVTGRYALENFPYLGESVVIEWEEALQNFVITERR